MKKIIKYLLLLIFIIPIKVFAFGIDNYIMDIDILDNGDILVEEYFELNGEYNGFERILEYKNDYAYKWNPNTSSYGGSTIHNGSGLIMKEIREVDYNLNFDFNNVTGTLYEEVSSASKGESQVYTRSGSSYMIYHPSTLNKAFYLKYIIKDVSIVHNDVGEFGFNIIGDHLRESVDNFTATIHIHNNKNELRVWAHGPLNGNIKIIDKETVKASIRSLYSYTPVDVRIVFDKDVISNSNKITGVNALDKILKYESSKAEEANYEREQEEFKVEDRALNSLIAFEDNPSRYLYEEAFNNINLVSNSKLKEEYLERLKIAKKKLDEIEEKNALDNINYLERRDIKYLYYDDYKDVLESIDVLDNKELKQELLVRLDKQKTRVIEHERMLERYNYILGVSELILLVGVVYLIYVKFDKEYKSEFTAKYFRDIPDDLSITDVSYLLYHKIKDSALSATIMDLVRKKVIKVEKDPKDKKNYIFTRLESDLVLSDTEHRALELLLCGSNSSSLNKMKKYAKKNYNSFYNKYTKFFSSALNTAKCKDMYLNEDGSNNSLFSGKYMLLLFILIVISPILLPLSIIGFIVLSIYVFFKKLKESNNKYDFVLKIFINIVLVILIFYDIFKWVSIIDKQHFINSSFILFILSILFIIGIFVYSSRIVKRTKYGNEEYAKWNAFRNFLNDFGSFKEKDLPEVYLWEHFLVFATLFGCAKKIYSRMKLSVKVENELDLADYYLINNLVRDSIRASYNTAKSARVYASSGSGGSSHSNFSSGSGSGGGFSSGGGSFGGGGGGGRF